MKQTFKLTESELHNLISECITEAIEDEGLGSFFGGMAKKLGRDAGSAMSNVGNRMVQGANNAYQGAKNMGNRIAQGANNAYQGVKDYGQSLYNAGVQQSKNIGSRIAQGANNAYQGVKDYGQSLYNAGVQQSNISDAQTAIKTIKGLVKKGILGQNIANMVVGNLRKYGNQ